MNKKPILILSAMSLLLIVPLIFAYNFGGWGNWGYYNSPLDYLQNPWVMFGIIFIILFGVIYYVLSKSFKNQGVSAAVALALSLFISMAISQRGLLHDYGGGELSSWALVIASLIAIAFLIRFVNESFGRIGTIIAVIIIWIIIHSLEPYEVLPNSLLNSGFFVIYEIIAGWLGLIIFIIIGFLLSGQGPRTLFEELQDLGRRRR
jgi:FtsH-binding integral membrane protein